MKKPSTGRGQGRRLARLGACAAAAGLVAVGMTATPALAVNDQLWITTSPWDLVVPKRADDAAQPVPTATLNLSLSHDQSAVRVGDGRITVDVSGLAGVAEAIWPENCVPAANSTAVCSVPEVTGTGMPPVRVPVKFRAVAGAAVGATGRIGLRATAMTPDGVLRAESGTDVRIGSGPDLVVNRRDAVDGVAPGGVVPVPVSAVNNGDQPANGVRVTYFATRGMALAGFAPQCASTPTGGGEGEVALGTQVVCDYDEVVPPGGSFTVPSPVTATVAPYGLYERIDVDVRSRGGVEDLRPDDNNADLPVTAANTADFAVDGARLTGAAGQTVRARLAFRNLGPAWVGHLSSGDPVAVVDVTVPQGATATAVPSECRPVMADGGWWESGTRTGAPRYNCRLPMWVTEQQTIALPFDLRIDTVVPGAEGTVTVKPSYDLPSLPFDPNGANNEARLTLNPAS